MPSVRGRPRSYHATEAVLAAAFAVLQEVGYGGLTIEGVAARAGVGKATIYRRWPERSHLAVDAFFACTEVKLAFPDTGSARGDLHAHVHALAELLRGPAGEALAGMIAGGRNDVLLRRAISERWVQPRRRWGQARLAAAIVTGECAPDLDVDAALSAVYGAVYWPLMLGRGVETAERLDAVLKIIFAGVFAPAGTEV